MEQIFFGERIAALRKARGMTQQALAQRLGITNQAVSKWESDQCCPDIMQLPMLADIFEISLDALFGRQEPALPEHREQEPATVIGELPWEDNDDLHAVCFVGHRLVRYQQIPSVGGRRGMFSFSCAFGHGDEPVQMEYSGVVKNIYSDFSVVCNGDVAGSVQAGESVRCGTVTGNVVTGDSVTCSGLIGMNAQAGGDIHCEGMIGGNATAGGDLECGGDIYGRVQAEGDVSCRGNIQLDVRSLGDLQCSGDIAGSVDAGGDVDCAGSIGGNASAKGNITCGSIGGNAAADGDITCTSRNDDNPGTDGFEW